MKIKRILTLILSIIIISSCSKEDNYSTGKPNPIINLTTEAIGGDIIVKWEQNVLTYQVEVALILENEIIVEEILSGDSSEMSFDGLVPAKKYIVSATVIDKLGNRSDRVFCDIELKEIIEDVKVATWLNGAEIPISFTWDDICTSHFNVIAPVFNQFDLKTSFYLIMGSGNFNTYKDDYLKVKEAGHEIGSHTVFHKDLTSLVEEDLLYEVAASQDSIKKYFGHKASTLVHPYSRTNIKVNNCISNHYLYSRMITEGVDYKYTKGINGYTNFQSMLKDYLDVKKMGKWLLYVGHGADNDGYGPIASSELTNFLMFVKSTGDIIWLDTFEKISLYNEVRNKVNISSDDNFKINIDDSKIVKTKYSEFGINSLPLTITFNTSLDYEFYGDGVLSTIRKDESYYVTINLLKGNIIHYK